MTGFTTIRCAGFAIVLIAALAACSQPEAAPSASEATSSTAAPSTTASEELTLPSADEGGVVTPDVTEQPTESVEPTDEPASNGTIGDNHVFADANSLIATFESGFEMFALGAISETEVDGRIVFISESDAGDAVVIAPSEDGDGIDTIRIVDVDAASEITDPLLLWAMMPLAILPEDAELGAFINDEVFAALEAGETLDTTETFGQLEANVVVDEAGDVTITISRAD